jgi:hypothetical protein
MDAAAAAYVALAAGGTDTLLMAADHALRRELNRRIREDLITLGIVSGGPAVSIADGTWASPGDLIICTRNDHDVEVGEPGRTLANGFAQARSFTDRSSESEFRSAVRTLARLKIFPGEPRWELTSPGARLRQATTNQRLRR